MDQNRHAAESVGKYKLYFDLLQRKINEYHLDARHTYNMDEKGFMIGITGRSKRVFSKAIWKAKGLRQSLQDGSRDWITLLACVCADGSALPPSLLFSSANKSIQSSWVDAIQAGEHRVFITSSPSGWTNDDIGLAWLEQVFNRETKAKARSSWRLLILDGHGSHVTSSFIDYCDQHRILLCVLPPHSTQTLQPLDVALFKPLSTAYAKELSDHLHRAQGQLTVKKGDFFELFWRAWHSSFAEKTIRSAFEHTGISPLNSEVILNRFTHETPEASSVRGSSTSALSAEDWRKTDRLVRSAVRDQSDHNVRKLRSSLHHISIQNELLRAENTSLRESLQVNKRHNKKSKRLDLQQRQEYHGGATFWSPRKVREAQYRETVTQREKQQQQLQKAETRELQQANKLHKQKMAEERRVAREAAKAAKERKKVDKAAERAAQKAARDAEKAIQLSQKRKRKASRAPPGSNKRQKRGGGAAASGPAPVPALAAPASTTRRGRPIKLPKKFK
jgi:hypothetical protein